MRVTRVMILQPEILSRFHHIRLDEFVNALCLHLFHDDSWPRTGALRAKRVAGRAIHGFRGRVMTLPKSTLQLLKAVLQVLNGYEKTWLPRLANSAFAE